MRNDTMHLQQAGNVIADKAVISRRSSLGEILRNALALLTSARPRNAEGYQPDGLEALDMLGGWQGSDNRRQRGEG